MRTLKVRLPFVIALAAIAAAALAGATAVQAQPDVAGAWESAPPAAGSATAGAFTLDVLTYNVLLIPFVPDRQDERMPLMAARLSGHDVLLLQEAYSDWHRVRLLRDLSREYPHQSRVLGRDRGLAQDGGVVIVSKWPIEAQAQRTFGDLCQGRDCMADKGVLYARINKEGRRVHLFAAHLQSGMDAAATRAQQLAVIGRLVQEMAPPAGEPVLLGGDLNVDRLDGSGEFAAMIRVLDARHPAPPGGGAHEPSLDPARNPLAAEGPAQYLDYVLYSAAHLRPSAAFNALRRIAARGKPLSDHFAVHGRFVFDPPARPEHRGPPPSRRSSTATAETGPDSR